MSLSFAIKTAFCPPCLPCPFPFPPIFIAPVQRREKRFHSSQRTKKEKRKCTTNHRAINVKFILSIVLYARAYHNFRANNAKINFREKEKKVLDQILGAGKYDARIRPSGINGTGESYTHTHTHLQTTISLPCNRIISHDLQLYDEAVLHT